MAVRTDAAEVDRALDRAARAFEQESHVALDRISSAMLLLSTWRNVVRHALEAGDVKLAQIANGEREHWQRIYESMVEDRGRSP